MEVMDGYVLYVDWVMAVAQVYAYIKTYQIVYVKYVQFTECQSYLNKTVKTPPKKKKKLNTELPCDPAISLLGISRQN